MKNWQFESFVYAPSGSNPLKRNYAQLPTPLDMGQGVFRFYFSSRDDNAHSRPFFVDYDLKKRSVIAEREEPILELGAPGMFDDSGIMPSSVIRVGDELYLYYIGWTQRKNISYQLAIGLAISRDNGETFKKYAQGPVLDRNVHDAVFCSAPCVHCDGSEFVMWYISATGWPECNGKLEPVYLVKRATSKDGVHWTTGSEVAIPYRFEGEAIGRPWVVYSDTLFHMWYSSRGSQNYRNANGEHYQIGYATSEDGVSWRRKDESLNFKPSGDSWDFEMQEYSSVFEFDGNYYMAYNGNTFGRSGFGLAKLTD